MLFRLAMYRLSLLIFNFYDRINELNPVVVVVVELTEIGDEVRYDLDDGILTINGMNGRVNGNISFQ